MQDAITALRAERSALRSRLEKIETAIEEYDRWAQSVVDLVGDVVRTQKTVVSNVGDANPQQLSNDPRPSSIKEFEETARSILEGSDHPIQRAGLLALIERMGIVVGGKDPANTMSTRLSRMKDITNLRGFGYWMKSRSFAPAGHATGYEYIRPGTETASLDLQDD